MTSSRSRPAIGLAHCFFVCLLSVLFFVALGTLALSPAGAAPRPDKLKPSDNYALIFGTVWGPDDRPVYGVKIYISQLPRKKPKWQLYSDHRGEFAQRVPAAKSDYVVGADLKGVRTTDGQKLHLVEEVPVHVEYDERVDIGLHLTK